MEEMIRMITMTSEAVSQLREFLDEQGTPDHALRVFVAPGGCSGLQYGMTIDEQPDEGDEVVETEGVRVLVDSFSAMYLEGAEIDYVNSLMGGGFTVSNPNAVAGCACGHSFDAGGNAGTAQGCGTGVASAGRV
ncbi:MAG TPA: iron-sulfur cluster insertion protein ErpA [Thermomicrobiales bacterium]|nr:iron-sulfur cluster insertion protein ErpA [Thermomicrobiales bacterium]